MKLSEIQQTAVPTDGFVQECSPTIVLLNWYAVYVKSRHEFVAFQELRKKQISAFLPSVHKISQWKDRRKLIEYPLFPGYLFVQVNPYPEEFLGVLKTRGIVTLISLEPGKPTPVAPEEIDSLRILIESGKKIDVYPHLMQGTQVRIKSGPLKNAEGIISKKENEYTFQVNVELLGRSVAIKMSAQELETLY